MTTAVRLVCVLAAIGATSVAAQDAPRPDTSAWKCAKCPSARSYVADYELGATYLSDDAGRSGNGTGYDEKGTYALAAGSGDFAGDAYRLRWDLADLGLDSRAVDIRGGQPGIYMYSLGYEELPYRRFDTTETVFRRSGADALALPAGWVPAGTTDGFAALDASLVDRDIRSDRQSFQAGGQYRGFDHLQLRANYRRTDRDGWGIAGASFFNNAVLLPAPFDDSTDTIDFSALYSRERWFAQLSWSGSYYDNSHRELRWDNPYLGGGQGALAQAPDSDAQTVTFAGAYHFAAQTVLSLSASIGEIRQDEQLLAYSINPALPADPLPRGSLDGKVDTTHLDLQLTSKPWSFLRLKGVYRYDDRDNGSPVSLWSRTITDLFPSGEAEANRPYSFQRTRLGLSAQARFDWYEWLESFDFEGGYDRLDTDRNLQEVADQSEETGWGRVRWRAGAAEISVRAGAARREADNYDLNVAAALEQNPLLRKYTLAYRFRDFAQLRATFGWPDQGLSVGAEVFYASDDYTHSPLGLRASDDRRFAADFTWTVSERVAAYLQGSYEDIESRSAGSESVAAADWSTQQRDRFRTVGGGIDFGTPSDRFTARLSLVQAKGMGDIDVASALSGVGAYPQLQTDLKSATVDLGYRLSAAFDLRLRFRYEDFSTSDWALQDVEAATLPTVLTLGADPYDDQLYLVSLSVRYVLGRRAASSATPSE
jgi:MtrB/PioB family decaheme-associated outer membrane protein